MSLYDAQDELTVDQDRPPERTAPQGASGRLHAPGVRSMHNVARRREANPVDYLLPASIRWLTSLPRDVRAAALASKYPRIVNLIVARWDDYDACCACFADLLADRRGTRRGFPADVHHDIRKLHEHYRRARPAEAGGLPVH